MFHNRTRMLFAALLLVILIAAWGRVAAGAAQLTVADAGRQIELRKGQTVEVALPGNPTTGYSWEVSEADAKVIKALGEPTFKADSGALGAGGVQTLRLQAAGAGQSQVTLVYRRPWEKGIAPINTFTFSVVVR